MSKGGRGGGQWQPDSLSDRQMDPDLDGVQSPDSSARSPVRSGAVVELVASGPPGLNKVSNDSPSCIYPAHAPPPPPALLTPSLFLLWDPELGGKKSGIERLSRCALS